MGPTYVKLQSLDGLQQPDYTSEAKKKKKKLVKSKLSFMLHNKMQPTRIYSVKAALKNKKELIKRQLLERLCVFLKLKYFKQKKARFTF